MVQFPAAMVVLGLICPPGDSRILKFTAPPPERPHDLLQRPFLLSGVVWDVFSTDCEATRHPPNGKRQRGSRVPSEFESAKKTTLSTRHQSPGPPHSSAADGAHPTAECRRTGRIETAHRDQGAGGIRQDLLCDRMGGAVAPERKSGRLARAGT